MSTHQGIFYVQNLSNCINGTLIFAWGFCFCSQLYNIKYFNLIQIICTQLYGFKYSYLIQIICTLFYDIKYSYLIQIIFTQFYGIRYSYLIQIICTQFFLSLRIFGLLSSSLLLFPQHFGRYVLRPSSDVCRTWEPTQNFELRPLLNSKLYGNLA